MESYKPMKLSTAVVKWEYQIVFFPSYSFVPNIHAAHLIISWLFPLPIRLIRNCMLVFFLNNSYLHVYLELNFRVKTVNFYLKNDLLAYEKSCMVGSILTCQKLDLKPRTFHHTLYLQDICNKNFMWKCHEVNCVSATRGPT